MAKKDNPSPGDFVTLAVKDLKDLEITMEYNMKMGIGVESFKKLIKQDQGCCIQTLKKDPS